MNTKAFAAVLLCLFCAFLGVGIVSPLLPLYADAMGASGVLLGLIFSSFTISRATVIPFVGPLSDRRGRKLFLLIGFGGYTLSTLGYILATAPFHLIITRVVQGATAGGMFPVGRAYIGDLIPRGEEGKWMGITNAVFLGGFATGPLLGGLLTEWYGWNAAFAAMGGLCLLGFLLTLRFLPESKPQQTEERRLSTKELFRLGFSNRTLLGLFSYRFIFAAGRAIFMTFLPLFAASLRIGTGGIGILLTARNISTAAVQPFFGKLADKFNKRILIITGAICNIAFFVLIPREWDFWQLLVVLIIGGVTSSISLPPIEAMYIKQGRIIGMGAAMSLTTMAMTVGMAIGPNLGGIVADVLNVKSVFYCVGGVLFIGIFLFFMLTRGYNLDAELDGQEMPDRHTPPPEL